MAHFKKPKQAIEISKRKHPVAAESYYKRNVSISFRKYDGSCTWSHSNDRNPTVESVFQALQGLEGMTWDKVMKASGGKSKGTNNHYIHVENMIKEARQRLEAIKCNETELFSIRLQSKVRLFGTIDPKSGCFYVLWYDPSHVICPVVR